MGREQVLRHLMRRKRHVILKPPGQETEGGSRDKLRMHGNWNREMLIGRRQFVHFGRYHFSNILLDQLLKAANPLSTQHQLVEMRVLCRVLEQTNKIGGRMFYRVRTGWLMLLFCQQVIVHLAYPLLKQGILILIMLVKRRTMNHGSLTNIRDGNLLECSLG